MQGRKGLFNYEQINSNTLDLKILKCWVSEQENGPEVPGNYKKPPRASNSVTKEVRKLYPNLPPKIGANFPKIKKSQNNQTK